MNRQSHFLFWAFPATLLLALGGCATLKQKAGLDDPVERHIAELQKSGKLEDQLTAIELKSGGRLGFAMMDSTGAILASYRPQERFAMCSTFKTLLAAATLNRVDQGKLSLRRRVSYTEADLLDYAPVVKSHFNAKTGKGMMTVDQLIKAIMVESDNSAANLLLKELGGPASVTAFARNQGDLVTRLDRTEPELNENGISDPRDSTTPAAMVSINHRILLGRQALRYTQQVLGCQLPESDHDRLMEAYLYLPTFPEVVASLMALKAQGHRLVAFTNGVEASIRALLNNAGALSHLEEVVSVDDLRTFKPDPAVYAYLARRTGRSPGETWLVSSNAWDVIGAKAAGLRAVWVKRQPEAVFDPWDVAPDLMINGLDELPTEFARRT